jgi:NAD(P)-dependent dehydrogenase (short-subunit alcohol dehydrogenase family)
MKKCVIITGGTGGLGAEVVRTLAEDYLCVVLHHGGDGFESLRREVGGGSDLHGIVADLADEQSVVQAMREAVKVAPPYALVHLVGGFARGSLRDTTEETWEQMLSVNVTTAFHVFREFARVAGQDGRIVAISSEATITKEAGSVAYTVGKSALNALVETTARELRPRGITVNALAPSALDTPAMRRAADRSTLVPLERVARTIAFLLSDEAASISGSIIPLRP